MWNKKKKNEINESLNKKKKLEYQIEKYIEI